MRGLAALAVIYFHRRWVAPTSWHIFDHGYLAVDFFFMLSGFVIAYTYGSRLRAAMTFADFFKRRAVRFYPLVILSVMIGGALLLVTQQRDLNLGAAIAANMMLVPFRDASLPRLGDVYFASNPPLYSLFFELIINLIFAALVPFLTPLRTMLIAASSFLVLLGTMQFTTIAAMGQHPGFGFFIVSGLARTSFSFFVGVALLEHRNRLPRLRINPILIGFATLLILLVPRLPGAWDELYNLAAISLAFPILVFVGSINEPEGRIAGASALLGALSYPVYALHVPLYGWYDQLHIFRYRASLLTAVVFVMLIAFAALRVYDEPLRQILNGALRRRRRIEIPTTIG